MNQSERIASLRAEAARLTVDYNAAAAALDAIGQRLAQIELSIRAAQSADSRALVAAAVEDRQRAAAAEEERVRAENAASHAAWLELQQRGETDEARREREDRQRRLIQIEEDREAREAENRRAKLDELRARGVTVYS